MYFMIIKNPSFLDQLTELNTIKLIINKYQSSMICKNLILPLLL